MGQTYDGTAIITYALFGSAIHPSSGVLSIDTNNTVGANIYLHHGVFYDQGNSPERWGDFSSSLLDPADGTRVWVTDQTALTNNWGTRIAQIAQ